MFLRVLLNTAKADKGLQLDVLNTAKNDKGLGNRNHNPSFFFGQILVIVQIKYVKTKKI